MADVTSGSASTTVADVTSDPVSTTTADATSEPAAKKPKTEVEVTIKLILMSGETLAEVTATTAWTIAEVKAAGNHHLNPGQIVQRILIKGQGEQNDAQVVGAVTTAAQIDFQVVIGTPPPTLHVFNPCSVLDLARRLADDEPMSGWYFKEDDEPIVLEEEGKQCYGMDAAPLDARTVAENMSEAAPDLEKIDLLISHQLSFKGTIVVIAHPVTDPVSTCFAALGVRERMQSPYYGDEEEGFSLKTLALVNKTVQHFSTITGLAKFNEEKDDEENMYLEDEDYQEMKSNTQLSKVQEVMSASLRDLFVFEFNNEVCMSPILFGGYASDGSIVGVLSNRYCSQS